MSKIIIQELERDDSPVTDIWATIEMASEKVGLGVQFQLEKLCLDWDMQKLESKEYKDHFDRWVKIAKNNRWTIMAENIHFIPKGENDK
jgi:hypothetical protein